VIAEIVDVLIDGLSQEDIVADIVEVETEEDVPAADVLRLRLALHLDARGSWNYVDDERFQVWRRVSLRAGYHGSTAMLFDGYVTHTRIVMIHGEESYLEVYGMDATAIMDLEERQRAWPNKRDDEIALTIFSSYGLSAEVEDTVAGHPENASTVMQADTDIRFLRRLAFRNGFECFVRGGAGFFRSPNMQEAPQAPLAIEFGGETNLTELRLSVDGTAATVVGMHRVDPVDKRVQSRERATSPRRALGARPLAELRSTLPGGRAIVREVAANSIEMEGRLRHAYHAANEFLRTEGEIDSATYRNVLHAKRLVTIKGVGCGICSPPTATRSISKPIATALASPEMRTSVRRPRCRRPFQPSPASRLARPATGCFLSGRP
jgi:hypothetical protein